MVLICEEIGDLSEEHEKEGKGKPSKDGGYGANSHIHLFCSVRIPEDGKEGNLFLHEIALLLKQGLSQERALVFLHLLQYHYNQRVIIIIGKDLQLFTSVKGH